MKKSFKTLVIMATVLSLVLGSIAIVSAVPYYDLETGKEYTAEMLQPGSPDREELKKLPKNRVGVAIPSISEDKVYSFNDLVEKLVGIFSNQGMTGIAEFFAKGEENLKEFEKEIAVDGDK